MLNTSLRTEVKAEPTRVRLGVLGFLFSLSMITYFDRVCISAAAPVMMDRLHLGEVTMSLVFSAFTFSYSIFEVPSGWLGDRVGARRILSIIVIWWSAFTALTGAAWNLASLLVVRLLFGAGEAGALPNISRSVTNWFPVQERGRAYGSVFTGTRIGGAIAPPIVAALILTVGWRLSFVVLGILGPIWAVLWYFWYRDDPAEHRRVNASELSVIKSRVTTEQSARIGVRHGAVPWRLLISNPNLILLCAIYFSIGYGLYFYLTWLPTYLVKVRHFSLLSSGLLAGLPLLCGAIGNIVGGWITDSLARRYSRGISRCLIGAVALTGSAVAIGLVAFTRNDMGAAVSIAVAAGFADLALPACWATCSDLSDEHSGVVSAFMNTLGNIGGTISPLVTGFVVAKFGDWRLPFLITALFYGAGAFLWLRLNPERILTSESVAA